MRRLAILVTACVLFLAACSGSPSRVQASSAATATVSAAAKEALFGTWHRSVARSDVLKELRAAGIAERIDDVWDHGSDPVDFWLTFAPEPFNGDESVEMTLGPQREHIDGGIPHYSGNQVTLGASDVVGTTTTEFDVDGDSLTFQFVTETHDPPEKQYVLAYWTGVPWTRVNT